MKRQVGWRLNRLLLDRFAEICRDEGLRPAEAVEEFMRRCLEVGSVSEALSLIISNEPKAILAKELRARLIMSDILGTAQDDFFEYYEEIYEKRIRELLSLIPGIRDPELVEEIKRFCERVNRVLRGVEEEG